MGGAAWYGWTDVMSSSNEHAWDAGNASGNWEIEELLKRILKSEFSKSNGK